MKKSIVITKPEHDLINRYFSKWSDEIIDAARKKGFDVVSIEKEIVVRKKFGGVLQKVSPVLIVVNGHGSDDRLWGHRDEVIIDMSDSGLLSAKIIFARACNAAKVLGEQAIKDGAIAFLGYRENFWLLINPTKQTRPLTDQTAAMFMKPSNQVAIALLKGHTTDEANRSAKKMFRDNILMLMARGPYGEDFDSIKYLYWNLTEQVCVGSQTATL